MAALPIEAAATVDTMTGINPVKDPLMAAFPDAPQGGKGIRRIGVDPVGKLLGPTAGLVSDVSKAAGAPIGVATGDGITDSQAEAVKRLVPFQSYIGMWQALDLLTADERGEANRLKLKRQVMCVEMPQRIKRGESHVGTRLSDQ